MVMEYCWFLYQDGKYIHTGHYCDQRGNEEDRKVEFMCRNVDFIYKYKR